MPTGDAQFRIGSGISNRMSSAQEKADRTRILAAFDKTNAIERTPEPIAWDRAFDETPEYAEAWKRDENGIPYYDVETHQRLAGESTK